jgi:hypothetical protein
VAAQVLNQQEAQQEVIKTVKQITGAEPSFVEKMKLQALINQMYANNLVLVKKGP